MGSGSSYWDRRWLRDPRKWWLFLLCWSLVATALCFWYKAQADRCPFRFAGGSPTVGGSCWCGKDGYCMCTPSLAIDAIIEVPGAIQADGKKGMPSIVLVHRRDPPVKHAIPGGFVDVGETVEHATAREVKEETNLDLTSMEQFHVYSDPKRDKRRHTVSSVFRCIAKDVSALKAKDDARSTKTWRLDEILALDLAFDHRQILIDYVNKYHADLKIPGYS